MSEAVNIYAFDRLAPIGLRRSVHGGGYLVRISGTLTFRPKARELLSSLIGTGRVPGTDLVPAVVEA
jgi:hypothetical protein